MTTYADFVTNLGDLAVSGVTTLLDEPPLSLNTADLPAQWVQLPEGDEGPLTVRTHGGWPVFRAQLIVALEPIAQETQSVNFAAAVDMMDNLSAALRPAIKTVCKGRMAWTVRVDVVEVAGHSYWATIADVEGFG